MGEAGIANHAQDRAGRVAEHGRYPAAVPGDLWPAHRVYAPEDRVEPPALDSMLDRIGVQAQLEELCAGDHPMRSIFRSASEWSATASTTTPCLARVIRQGSSSTTATVFGSTTTSRGQRDVRCPSQRELER